MDTVMRTPKAMKLHPSRLFLLLFLILHVAMMPANPANEPNNHQELRLELVSWEQLQPKLPEVSELFLHVYKEYPYFFPGPASEFLEMYEALPATTIACIALDGEALIGIAVGLCAQDAFIFYKNYLLHNELYLETNKDLTKMFFVGDMIILSAYRNKGLGKKIYQLLEEEIKKHYSGMYLCTIQPSVDEHLKPANYLVADIFWAKQGFIRVPGMYVNLRWQDLNDTKVSSHHMPFWIKEDLV